MGYRVLGNIEVLATNRILTAGFPGLGEPFVYSSAREDARSAPKKRAVVNHDIPRLCCIERLRHAEACPEGELMLALVAQLSSAIIRPR